MYKQNSYYKFQEILAEQAQSLEHIRVCEQTIDSLKLENTNLLHQRNELEKSLAKSNIAIKEYAYRESKALEKIQETLCITEMAIREKDTALEREKEIQGNILYYILSRGAKIFYIFFILQSRGT